MKSVPVGHREAGRGRWVIKKNEPGTGSAGRFRQRLQTGPPLLLDGATGTELNRRGVDTSMPLWSARALLDAEEILLEVHRDYVDAGAEIITANTFRAHRRSLVAGGHGDQAEKMPRRAVEIAHEAAGHRRGEPGDGVEVYVAGSIAPLEDCYSPHLVPANAALETEHGEMAGCLADAGADLLLVETMNTIREAEAAAGAAVATGLPVLVGFVCGRDGRLLSGEALADAAASVAAVGVDGLMINCTPTPDITGMLAQLAASSALPLAAYGNVGYADEEQGWVNTDSVDPRAYAGYAAAWIDGGARIVGSCCGTGPAHTRALRRLIDRV